MAVVWMAAGCLEAEPAAAPSCSGCHGSSENPAPPTALGGYTDPAYRGVGAHQVHVAVPAFSNAVACSECHVVPEEIEDTGHIDLWPAEVSWAQAEIRPNVSEPFDGDALTCVVYCHGATLEGGTNTTPKWTETLEGAVCDDCHGFPPLIPPHQAGDVCSGCHPNPLDGPTGVHIDGVLQEGG